MYTKLAFNNDPELKKKYLATIIAEILTHQKPQEEDDDLDFIFGKSQPKQQKFEELNEEKINFPKSFSHIRMKLFEYLQSPEPLKLYHKFIEKVSIGLNLYPVTERFMVHLLSVAYTRLENMDDKKAVNAIIEDYSFHIGYKYNPLGSPDEYKRYYDALVDRATDYKKLTRTPDRVDGITYWRRTMAEQEQKVNALHLADYAQEMLKLIIERNEYILAHHDNYTRSIELKDQSAGIAMNYAIAYAIELISEDDHGKAASQLLEKLFEILNQTQNEQEQVQSLLQRPHTRIR